MATSLKDLRAMLARRVGCFHTSTATGGSESTIIDTKALARFTVDDTFKGALVYIRAAGGENPEGKSRWITGYAASTQTITVEYVFPAAVENNDTYEIFIAPLSEAQWDDCINAAIREAWPFAWTTKVDSSVTTVAEQRRYALSGITDLKRREHVLGIWMEDSDDNYLPIGRWFVEDTAGTLTLELDEDPPDAGRKIRIEYQIPFPELSGDLSTDLDTAYIMAAAQANWHGLMADVAHGQADASNHLKLMSHWQKIAEQKRVELRSLYRRPSRKPRTTAWHQHVS